MNLKLNLSGPKSGCTSCDDWHYYRGSFKSTNVNFEAWLGSVLSAQQYIVLEGAQPEDPTKLIDPTQLA